MEETITEDLRRNHLGPRGRNLEDGIERKKSLRTWRTKLVFTSELKYETTIFHTSDPKDETGDHDLEDETTSDLGEENRNPQDEIGIAKDEIEILKEEIEMHIRARNPPER